MNAPTAFEMILASTLLVVCICLFITSSRSKLMRFSMTAHQLASLQQSISSIRAWLAVNRKPEQVVTNLLSHAEAFYSQASAAYTALDLEESLSHCYVAQQAVTEIWLNIARQAESQT